MRKRLENSSESATFAMPINEGWHKFFLLMLRKALEKRLRDAGCVLSRHGANHDKWVNVRTNACGWIPRHNEIAEGTAMSILKRLTGE